MERKISRKVAKPQRKTLSEFLALFVFCFLLTAFGLLPSSFTRSLKAKLLPRDFSQSEAQSTQVQPSPSPAPSPSPSPTPPPNLHQWGEVNMFHRLPSGPLHARPETRCGTLRFCTELQMA